MLQAWRVLTFIVSIGARFTCNMKIGIRKMQPFVKEFTAGFGLLAFARWLNFGAGGSATFAVPEIIRRQFGLGIEFLPDASA